MKLRHLVILSGLVATAPFSASAQVSVTPQFTIFAGAVIPTGEDSDDINTGYTAGVALDVRLPASSLGLRAEGLYAKFDLKNAPSGSSADFSDIGVNVNGVLWFPMTAPSTILPYVTAGPSFSRVRASASVGSVDISDTVNKFGFNAGGGIEFGLGSLGARVDVRYKRISMEDGSYQSIPITFGLRF